MIIYHWTGEYRPPKKGEWFMSITFKLQPVMSNVDSNIRSWILRREEIDEYPGQSDISEKPHTGHIPDRTEGGP